MHRLVAVLCAFVCTTVPAVALGAPKILGDFDWRQNGGNWVTPIRNQGPCGSCWAFGATAALESQFLINAGTPGIDLNLSEQHLLCDGGPPNNLGSCQGGWEFRATTYFVSHGITDEVTLPYQAQNTSPLWPLEEPYTLYKTDAVQNFFPGDDSTSGIKSFLEETGPLPTFFDTVDWFTPPVKSGTNGDSLVTATDFTTPEYYQENGSGGLLNPGGSPGYHCVAIVGYKDEGSVPGGGYWIVKNSWGTGWGDEGYGFIEYGDIEKWNRTHAIVGNTFTELVGEPIPEPSAILVWSLLGLTGAVFQLCRSRRMPT